MALIYRAYYALNKNPRITSKGLNTSAILGFANTLLEVIRNEKPGYIAVAFDTHAPTQRHVDFVEYKSQRQAVPEDILKSIPYIVRLIEAMNIPVLAVDGYEADDIIGTLATKAGQEGYKVFMMTPDKDFAQLVTENVFLYKPGKFGDKAVVMGTAEVCARYCVKRPEQVKDLLGLWGDASDNIPGVPGIGEVTARKLIEQFDSVENLIDNALSIDNVKLREKITAFSKQALLSKQLATIILDVPVDTDIEALKLQTPDFNTLNVLLEELEFKSFGERVRRDFSNGAAQESTPAPKAGTPDLFSGAEVEETVLQGLPDINTTRHNYHIVTTPEEINVLVGLLEKAGNISIDAKTTGKDPNNVELTGLSFSIAPGEAWYVPVPANYGEALEIVRRFAGIYSDERIEKTGHNLKYDIAVLSWYEVVVKGPIFDTMIAHYLLEPDLRHNVDYLAATYLKYRPITIESLIGKGRTQVTMREVPLKQAADFACEDADITLQLRQHFEPMIKEAGLDDLLRNIEMPLVRVLAAMEAEGVKVDTEVLKAYSQQLEGEIATVENEIYNLAGEKFNIGSPKQLGEILFDKMKIADNPKQTKTKQHSTGEEILLKLAGKHAIINLILEYRSLTKLKSTYIDALPLLVNPRTGRIHTSYNQAVAATGRLSSNNPNLQNIPIRTERGREIRKAFIPRNAGHTIVSADYSQIELRIIAEISGDEAMQAAFREGVDIHTATAAKIYNVSLGEVTKDMRRNAKTVNFGIIYGISAFGLSERLNIPRKEAADIIAQYFERFSGIKKYMEESIKKARAQGYVETLMKRRRYLRDINSANAVVRAFAERNAINAPIQGSSADMIKIAMINIYNRFSELGLKSKMILQVHDELVFDVVNEELETVKPVIVECMKSAMPLSIPVEVDLSKGNNWLEAH